MTTIVVSAIVSDGLRVLLARGADERWGLPGGLLLDDDESMEEALVRVLRARFRIEVETQDFLDTYYEPLPDATLPLLNNVSLVETWSERPLPPDAGVEWFAVDRLPGLDLNETAMTALRDGLGVASGEEPLPGAPVLLLTGPPGAGKSSAARALCARLARSAYVEADLLRHMVIGGYASPVAGQSNPLAAAEQNELQLANVLGLARNFSLGGFQTVIDLVLTEPEELDRYLEAFAGVARVYFATLLPRLEVIEARDQGRDAAVRQGERVRRVYDDLLTNGEDRGLRLDSSAMSVEETAVYVLEHLEQARVG